MDAKFSQKIKDVLSYSKEEAVRMGNAYISPEHFFLGILREGDGMAVEIITSIVADLTQLKKIIELSMKVDSNAKIKDA